MHNYNNLQIWQQSMDLTTYIYKVVSNFPSVEKFGIASQMTRAAVSIPSNIAEGSGRATDKEFAHFLSIAIGSAYELHTQIIVCERVGYIDATLSKELQQIVQQLQRMLIAFKNKLSEKNA